ncbi:DNA topoisomerase-3 [Ereboglobus sp. PH5-5]|uniref:type IA DNA topoisomerase n=1 Tax=Ereboglobus sp. PH5-5 TaxID=2940529 RepID=UPI002405B36F|nr:type IA DNA topoisomerase [Ereboglobus sp. PH5-5]MDF9832454.1 DNA topoisomerase-3 [Ereboglobus sp. PH5-5]
MKSLIIAEKPSVAADLARALGKVPKKGDHYENDQYVIASAVGHLVELQMPEDIDKKKYGFWRLETLPIIPNRFELKPIDKTKDRFGALKKLLARKDIDEVINACDAGREGELIFTYIYQLAKSKLPVRRAWMQTMTPAGIRAAFEENHLRTAGQMSGLADAARCRSEADWLIGINGTRALTKRMFGKRAGNVASVGRVQTPTLALVVARELEIRNFVSRDYWRITAQFGIANGSYEGVYQRPGYKKNDADPHDRIDRLWDKADAEAVLADCRGNPPAAVTEEKKAATQIAPRLYDLTTLQREANNRLGLSARRTLQIAQALYEKHKMITYPRTDSRALPEDYIPTCKTTLQALEGNLAPHAQKALAEGYVRPNKRIFNNAQISDHFAIIPTGSEYKNLDDMEARVFDMIARRFVAAFYPVAEYDVTTRISTIAQKHNFKTEGKVLTNPGWLAVYGRTSIDEENASTSDSQSKIQNPKSKIAPPLPALTPSDNNQAKTISTQLHAEATKPPPRYTEATLLSAMESAGKLVDDEDMADAMKERGLGTPATRADTIDGLIYQKYMERNGRELSPTPKAEGLLEFLSVVGAEALTKPDMTGEWEYKLRLMEHNNYTRDKFMREIVDVTKGVVERTKNFEEDETTARVTDIISPTDNQPMKETLRAYKSQDGALAIYKVITGRKIEEDEIRQLVAAGEIGPLDGFVSPRTGNRFPSKLRIIDDPKNEGQKKVELDFGNKVDLSALTPVWTDPKTGEELCEAPTNYILRRRNEKADGGWEQTFSVGRLMCQKPIELDQAIKLVTEGKTDLIQAFISKRGRPFDAYLLRKGARIAWEFPPRAPKVGKDGKPVARKTKAAPDLTKATKIGDSKAHEGGTLYETADSYIVAKPGANDEPRIVFECKKSICQKDIALNDVQQMLADGKSPLIEGFVSKRGSQFNAYLVLSKDKKKADFEFPPR